MSQINEAYGVKAIRQLRNTNNSKQFNIIKPNLRKEELIKDTYNYFLKEVDPIVGDCVTYLLCIEPSNVPIVMLEYFQQRKKGIKLVPSIQKDKPEKVSKSQRLFLATQISPVLTKIVNRIATHRPKDILGFLCTELENLIQSAGRLDEDERINNYNNNNSNNNNNNNNNNKNKSQSLAHVHLNNNNSSNNNDNNKHGSHVNNIPQGPKNIQIVILGNGGSGKTSFINALQGKFDSNVRPTIGFRPTSMMMGDDIQVKFYDLGGGVKIRNIWPEYFHDVHGIVYMIDSSIKDGEACNENIQLFHDTISHPILNNKPLLVVANKQDVPGALSSNDIQQLYSIDNITSTSLCHITETSTSCLSSNSNEPNEPELVEQEADPRIEKSVEWLLSSIQSHYSELNVRVENDTKAKQLLDEEKRIKKERRVLKNKILSAFFDVVAPEYKTEEVSHNPEDIFTKDEGESFLASEIGEELLNLPPIAIEIASLVGYQRLALQMIGALKSPISKKKKALSWEEIREIVVGLRAELGLY